jgi:5-methylcytosine-specific restriction endonuclease McrA
MPPVTSTEPRPTLVLTSGYEPYRVVSWRRAIKLLVLGKAEALVGYADTILHSGHQEQPAPAVIRVLTSRGYHYHSQCVKLHREFLYARDQWRCQYCGETFPAHDLTFDHVKPRSKGGVKSWENLVAACKSCNQKKDRRTPVEAKMPLQQRPRRPSWFPPVLLGSWGTRLPKEWNPYVAWVLVLGEESSGN